MKTNVKRILLNILIKEKYTYMLYVFYFNKEHVKTLLWMLIFLIDL